MEQYYYSRMNKAQKSVYKAMKGGLESLAPSFQIPLIPGSDLAEVYFLLRLDNPDIFYAEGASYRYCQDSGNAEMIPEYLFDKKKVQEHQKAMKSRVEKLVRPAVAMSEMEKLQYIHDFICENIRYDKLKKQYSHEIIGPLGQGVGVCEGIAKSVKILCDALGLWCIIAISENNPEKGIKYRHAWNIVKVNGKCYHFDATFDNSLSKEQGVRYDYFMLSDKQIARDHEPVIWQVPECGDSESFYYRMKKLSFTKMEDVRKRSAQAVKKGRVLTFHWRGGYMTKEVVREMLDIFEEEAVKKSKHARVALNWPQSVVRVAFEEQLDHEEVVYQEANEGEKE